jgi:LacI family transcriptional regulator
MDHENGSGKAPDRQLTIQEIARMAEVSVATVSRVLNGNPQVEASLAERVNKVIQETGYRPSRLAQAFARGRLDSIALVSGVPEAAGTSSGTWGAPGEIRFSSRVVSTFVLTLAVGIYDAIQPGGYRLHFVSLPENVQSLSREGLTTWFENTMDHREVAGVIFMNPAQREPLLDVLVERERPSIVIGDTSTARGVPRVDVDNVEGVRSVTSHLLELGHRRIAFLSPRVDRTVVRDRSEGFCEAFEYRGAALPRDWWLETSPEDYPLYSHANARKTVEKALKGEFPFTAVVAYNDEMAFGAIQAFSAHGWQVPQRVSVVGFDDLPAAAMYNPPLTTVRQDIVKIGQYAARLLLRSLKGKEVPPVTIIPTEIVVRSSSAAPAAQQAS